MDSDRKGETDAHVHDLRALHERVGKLFDRQSARQGRLEKQIHSLQQEHELGEERLGELGLVLAQLETALDAARRGEVPPADDLMEPRTAHSRRGPVGFRGPILEIMSERPEAPWSPQDVHIALGAQQLMTSLRNVGHTMRKMAADGQLERLGHGAYGLRREDE
jgi:hypothetical protein